VGKSLSASGYYSLHSCSPTLSNKGELCVARFRSSLELERIDASVYRTGPVNVWLAENEICKEGGALLLKNANRKQNRNRNQNQNPEHQITPDFPIFLRKLDGSTAVLSVRADDYEEDLCREAVKRSGVPGDQLFLTINSIPSGKHIGPATEICEFVNTVLRPRQNNGISIGVKKSSRRLKDLGISRNSTICLSLHCRGGANLASSSLPSTITEEESVEAEEAVNRAITAAEEARKLADEAKGKRGGGSSCYPDLAGVTWKSVSECGTFACIFCKHIGPAAEICEFITERDGGQTAICPRCSIDAILPRNKLPENQEECMQKLAEYYEEGFGGLES